MAIELPIVGNPRWYYKLDIKHKANPTRVHPAPQALEPQAQPPPPASSLDVVSVPQPGEGTVTSEEFQVFIMDQFAQFKQEKPVWDEIRDRFAPNAGSLPQLQTALKRAYPFRTGEAGVMYAMFQTDAPVRNG